MDQAEGLEGPNPQEDPADDHVVADASHGGIPAVDTGGAVVAHDETATVGHLIRQFDVALPQRLVADVRFLQ